MVAIICATYSWLLTKNGYDTFSNIPPLFLPSILMMGLGISLIPFFCLPLLVVMVVFVFRSTPRSYTILVFFGLQFAVFAIDISFWGNGMRFIFAMLLAAFAVIVEVSCRNLPKGQLIAGIASFFVTVAWYIATICVCASASV
jgi:hypothetical protein